VKELLQQYDAAIQLQGEDKAGQLRRCTSMLVRELVDRPATAASVDYVQRVRLAVGTVAAALLHRVVGIAVSPIDTSGGTVALRCVPVKLYQGASSYQRPHAHGRQLPPQQLLQRPHTRMRVTLRVSEEACSAYSQHQAGIITSYLLPHMTLSLMTAWDRGRSHCSETHHSFALEITSCTALQDSNTERVR
jgi:hypothetical protein